MGVVYHAEDTQLHCARAIKFLPPHSLETETEKKRFKDVYNKDFSGLRTETLEWLKEQGGVKAIEKINQEKAALLYAEVDRNPLFIGFANKEDRSTMNVTFNLTNEAHKDTFDKLWNEAGINGLKGHKSVGGYRASIYNAMPIESIKVLINVMQQF